MTLDPVLTRAVAREVCTIRRAMHGKVPTKAKLLWEEGGTGRKCEAFLIGKASKKTMCRRPAKEAKGFRRKKQTNNKKDFPLESPFCISRNISCSIISSTIGFVSLFQFLYLLRTTII